GVYGEFDRFFGVPGRKRYFVRDPGAASVLRVAEAARVRHGNHLNITPGETSPNLHDLGDVRRIPKVLSPLQQLDYNCEYVALARELGQMRREALSGALHSGVFETFRVGELEIHPARHLSGIQIERRTKTGRTSSI